ncbi:radical SAM family heme chaperone HemW [Bacillus timonensis]|nr:radical SAM family heme chaperone HemW [Bacillus timonensis]
MVKAAYLHIPFCEQICHYCDFNKVFLKNQPVIEYLQLMDIEIKNTLSKYPTEELETIFVGGGTPTALDEQQLQFFLEIIKNRLTPLSSNRTEYTFEANPGDLSFQKLLLLREYGVNRLSFGVQTFDDTLLKEIGRTHRRNDVLQSIELAKEAGFKNISIDLIYALPSQNVESFRETLKIAFEQNVQHFSAYSLIIEPKTVFYNLMKKGKLRLPSQDNEALMYEILMDEMSSHGYDQYEISNFSKPGFESKHNLTYWNNEEYYGFGAGAHSYVFGNRCANAGPLKKYMANIEESGFPYTDIQQVDLKEKMEEELFLGLRKTEGVSITKFEEKFNRNIYDVFSKQINEQIEKELLEKQNNFLKLTRKGKLLGNEVFQAFLV